jgi:hypothetical protein
MNKHIVIFSHGFGVQKDGRGLFTDIAAGMPGVQTILFDYNHVDEAANTLTVMPLTAQAEVLRHVVNEARAKNPDATIDLICHSQGCVVAGMLQPSGLHKIVLLAPPATLSKSRMMAVFGNRPGAHEDKNGTWRFPRRDGSTTLLPKEYWPSIASVDPIDLYNRLADTTTVTVIHANQDEILGEVDFSKLSARASSLHLDANHDFTGPARKQLIQMINKELAQP